MLDTTPSSQGSKATLSAGAGLSPPELETVPLPTPPYVTRLPPATPRRRRPGAALSSPMVVLSRGWLRRHRPAVVITAAVLGTAVLVVLLAALAYHVSPSTVSEDYELEIEEPENVEVPLEQHVIEELDTSRPFIFQGSGSVVEHPRPKDAEDSEARAADGAVLVARWEEERPAQVGAVLRDAVKSSRSPSRSRRHRTDDSFDAGHPPLQRHADRPRILESLSSMQGPYLGRGGPDVSSAHRANERPLVDKEPNVIQLVSRDGQGSGLRKWAALPFDQSYDVELDEIGNSVSESIKQASGTEKPLEYAREYSLGSDARHRSEVSDSEWNLLDFGIFKGETLQDPEERVVHTMSKWPVNHRVGQQDRLVTVIEVPGVIRRQKRSESPEADGHGLNLIKRLRKRDGVLGSLSQENSEKTPANIESSVVGGGRLDRTTPFRGKRQVYWGPFYDPHHRFPVHAENKEDASSEEESSKDQNLVISPYHWYYTPQRAAAYSHVYLPYGDPGLQYWPSYPPHAPYYRNEVPVAQPDFYRASSLQDIASTQQFSRQYEGTSGEVSDTEVNGEAHPQSRQMEHAFETSVVAPINISPDLFSRAMQSKTPTEFAKHLKELSETHVSNLRAALHDNGRRLEAFTVLPTLHEDTGKHPQSDSLIAESPAEDAVESEEARSAENVPQRQPAIVCRPKESESSESSSEEDTPGRAAEPGLEKLFTADGIVRLLNILPSETLKKIIDSLSTEALADLLKGLSKEEIAKIQNSLPPEKLEAIKKMFSPEELEEVKGKLGMTSDVTSPPASGQQMVEIPKRFGGPTATAVSGTTGSAVKSGGLGQRQAEDGATGTSPGVGASQVGADSSEEASEEDYSDGGPGASTYAPLTAVPESSMDAAQAVPEQLEEETQPGEDTARSFLRRNGTGSLLQKRLRPGMLQQVMATMGSPVAAAGMAQMAAQDQRLGREMEQANPLDAVLAASAQRQLRADPSDVILSTLTALAEDVHWIRMLLADSNATLVGAARSSLLDAELEAARRKFLQHSSLSGSGLSHGDRERLAALPPGLAQELAARPAGRAVSTDFPTGLGADYTGVVEATASTAYTVSSPGLDATTPKTWTQGQYLLTTKPGVTAPLLNTGIHFPSQPSGSAFEHKTLDGGEVVALPAAPGAQHVPVCIYGHQEPQQQQPAPWPFYRPLAAPPQAAAFASAVAILPQPQLLKPDGVGVKDMPMLHHQQNVYNYYSGMAWPPHAQPHQHTPQQQHQQQLKHQPQLQQQPLLHPVFCGWLSSPQDTHLPSHSLSSPLKPYFGWRADSQAGIGAEANIQKSAVLQVETTKADKASPRQTTTTGEAVFTEKPLTESESPSPRDSHSEEGKSQPGEAVGGDQLPRQSQNESSPTPQTTTKQQAATTGATTQRSTQLTSQQTSATAPDPCCDGTTDAAEERERAKLASEKQSAEERQRFASEVRPLQGRRAALLPGLSATPTVPILSSTDGQGATNR